MKFVLNEGLAEINRAQTGDFFGGPLSRCNSDLVGRNWQSEQMTMLRTPDTTGVECTQIGYLNVLARAYSDHSKIVLNPHDVWYLILSEVAALIEKNVEACRPIFTRSPSKIQIAVPTDDVTAINLNLIEAELVNLVPVDLGIFLPQFTTMTDSARYACLAAFCDSASHYYEYMTFLCGIPEIDIQGSVDDWAAVQNHALQISDLLTNVGLSSVAPWIDRACRAVDNILTAITREDDPTTLQTIFTASRVGSGGQLKIDGWFADLYRDNLRGQQLESFPSTICRVPYKNLDTGREFIGAHGCFMTKRREDGFIYGDYGEIILEKVAREPRQPRAPSFNIERITVEAKSRAIGAQWAFEPSEDMKIEPSDDIFDEISNQFVSDVSDDD